MKSLFVLFAVLVFSMNVFAVEEKICVITSNLDKDIGELRLEVVKGNIHSARILRRSGQKILTDDSFPGESLLGTTGFVATEREGHKVVVVKFERFNLSSGGTIVINYLVNAITKSRREFRLKLVKEGNSFALSTLDDEKVNRVHFYVNRILRKPVGIRAYSLDLK